MFCFLILLVEGLSIVQSDTAAAHIAISIFFSFFISVNISLAVLILIIFIPVGIDSLLGPNTRFTLAPSL